MIRSYRRQSPRLFTAAILLIAVSILVSAVTPKTSAHLELWHFSRGVLAGVGLGLLIGAVAGWFRKEEQPHFLQR